MGNICIGDVIKIRRNTNILHAKNTLKSASLKIAEFSNDTNFVKPHPKIRALQKKAKDYLKSSPENEKHVQHLLLKFHEAGALQQFHCCHLMLIDAN